MQTNKQIRDYYLSIEAEQFTGMAGLKSLPTAAELNQYSRDERSLSESIWRQMAIANGEEVERLRALQSAPLTWWDVLALAVIAGCVGWAAIEAVLEFARRLW